MDIKENEETMLKNSNELFVSDADQYDNRQKKADHKSLTKTYKRVSLFCKNRFVMANLHLILWIYYFHNSFMTESLSNTNKMTKSCIVGRFL